MEATKRHCPNFRAIDADLVNRALYEALSDGHWHHRNEVVAAVAPSVPSGTAYRWRLDPKDAVLTGIDRSIKIARGQRGFVQNRIMINTRRQQNFEVHPTDRDLIRLAPHVHTGWVRHRQEHRYIAAATG